MKKWSRILSAFILGMLVGSSLLLFYTGPILQELETTKNHLKFNNTQLKEQNAELKNQISQLEERNKKSQNTNDTIQDIIVNVGKDEKMNDLELEVAKRVKDDVEWMIGQSIEGMNEFHQGIHTLFRDKKYQINEREVSIHLKTLIIQKNVYLYLTIELEN